MKQYDFRYGWRTRWGSGVLGLDLGPLHNCKFKLEILICSHGSLVQCAVCVCCKGILKNSDSCVSAQCAFRCECNLPSRLPGPLV